MKNTFGISVYFKEYTFPIFFYFVTELLSVLFLEANTPTPNDLAEHSWLWLVDLERTCSLLVGKCLGGMLIGSPSSEEERETGHWLSSTLFSHGLEKHSSDLGNVTGKDLLTLALLGCAYNLNFKLFSVSIIV
jgi:hypothetical protein